MLVVLRRMEDLGGLPVAADEVLETDRVTLGRGTDQDVQLPDMRVTLAHAEIRQQPGGGYRIECTGENPVTVNGSPTLAAALGSGDVVECGRFRLIVGTAPAGVDLLLEVEESMSARQDAGRRRAQFRTTLEQAGVGRRRAAWGLAVLVLLPLFAAPVALRFGGGVGRSLDVVLQAGPPSASHSPFVEDCGACHEAPFMAVRSEACAACHRDQPHHSARPELLAAPGLGDGRCGDCHLEHTGRDGLVARNPALCTACHAGPDARFAAAQLAPARRFADAHPGFTPTVPAWKDGKLHRVESPPGATAVRESPNLAFPHDVHVADRGLSSPEGLRVLACADCHRAAGPSFVPIRMEEHCAGCHRLDFEPDAPEQRLPHRAPREVAALIRGHYARVALAGEVKAPDAPEVVRLLRRPGEVLTPAQSQAALAWAEARAAAVMRDVFERRVCATCHQVVATGHPPEPWRIEPVALSRSFLTDARFDHAAHRTEPCSRCHAARSSASSGDLLLPGIDNCRACHGDPGDRGLIGSACVDCHRFHVTGSMVPAAAGAAP